MALWPSAASFIVAFPSQLHFCFLLLGSSLHHLCSPSDMVHSRLLPRGRLMLSNSIILASFPRTYICHVLLYLMY